MLPRTVRLLVHARLRLALEGAPAIGRIAVIHAVVRVEDLPPDPELWPLAKAAEDAPSSTARPNPNKLARMTASRVKERRCRG